MIQPPKLDLAFLPTPLVRVNYNGNSILIKRDDITGMETSGNKIRKLEYLLAEAKQKKADIILTTGGLQSNHARATTAAAAALGIKVRLYLWGEYTRHATGNLFINKFLGAEIVYLDYEEFVNASGIMKAAARELEAEGKNVYIIPEGGSSVTGIQGYINFWEELGSQTNLNDIKEIWVAAGSGGTAAGLLIGARRKKLSVTIKAVSVLYPVELMQKKIDDLLSHYTEKYGATEGYSASLQIVGGYSQEGYKQITPEKVAVLRNFARATGIILDPVYTGKAFFAMSDSVRKSDGYEGKLFLHTGGFLGVFDKTGEYLS